MNTKRLNAALAAQAERLGIQHLRPVLDERTPLAHLSGIAKDMGVNATLRKDEFEIVDETVTTELRDRMTVFSRFRELGLIQVVGIGDIERVTERLNGFSEAQIVFDAEAEIETDAANYENDRRAVPMIAHGFGFGMRQLASSEKRGANLQVDQVGLAARAVADKFEDLITNGLASGGPSGGGVPGLTTAANAIDVSLGTPWDESGATPVDDVTSMLAAAYARKIFGPFDLWIPNNWWAAVQDDYSDQKGDRTFLERIEAFPDIMRVLPNDKLAADNAVLVAMDRQFIDISLALNATAFQYKKNPFRTDFVIGMIGGPHIKNRQYQNSSGVWVPTAGIVHLS